MRVLFISAANEAGSMVPLPLGLACVASATELAGHCASLIVLDSDADVETDVRRAIEEFSPEAIGISVRNIDDQNMQNPRFLLGSAKEVVAACRTHSGAPIVIGGAGYSIFPESALEYVGADIGIRGEGEAAFPALLEWLQNERRTPAPPGTYLADGKHSTVEFAHDLDFFLLPDPHLWLAFPGSETMRVPVQSRRGCPLGCIYCSTSTIEGELIRHHSPEAVVNWLRSLRKDGFRDFYFVDNTFNLPPSYAKHLCHKLIEADLGLDWWAIIYPKFVEAELAELMAKAGCTQVSLGFESGSDVMLAHLNKRFTHEEVRAVSEAFAATGIKRNGFLLLGGPHETRETVEESLEFADSLQLDMLKTTVGIRIYPNTQLEATAVADGLISRDDNLLLPRFYVTPSLREWLPERVTRRETA